MNTDLSGATNANGTSNSEEAVAAPEPFTRAERIEQLGKIDAVCPPVPWLQSADL